MIMIWISGAALVALPLYALTRSGSGQLQMAGLFALFPTFFLIAGAMARRNRLREIDAVAALLDPPDDVVWVFPTATRVNVNGIPVGTHGSLTIATSTRRAGDFVALGDHLAPLYGALQRALPHATFGWSKERVAQYNRDPASLRLDAASPVAVA